MAYHVPFVDGDISQSNRIISAWLNGVNNAVYGTNNGTADSTMGSALLQFIQGGTSPATRTVQAKLREPYVSLRDFPGTWDGVADDTVYINRAYAQASAAKVPLMINGNTTARFTSQLNWNGGVDVFGEDSNSSILKKDGNFTGILISGGGQQSHYSNFQVTAVNDVAGNGIQVQSVATMMLMDRIAISGHSGHGLYLYYNSNGTAIGMFKQIEVSGCGGDGIRLNQSSGGPFTSLRFETISCLQNTGWGFNIVQGNACVGVHLVLQQNTAGGLQIDTGVTNNLEVYCENNVGTAISCTANSVRNRTLVTAVDNGATQVLDVGTNNQFWIQSGDKAGLLITPEVTRLPPAANTTGLPITIVGGTGGSGAGSTGGSGTFGGGQGGGTDGAGGDAHYYGGPPTGTGQQGKMLLQEQNGNVIVVGNTAGNVSGGTSCIMDFASVTRVICINRLTTAQKNALTPFNGMIVYDTSLDKFQGYQGGSWVSFA